jgi:hypothetical protein
MLVVLSMTNAPGAEFTMSLPMYRAFPPVIRSARCALLACALALVAAAAGGCAKPEELLTGTTSAGPGRVAAVAPWQTRAAASAEAVRPLSDGEGEVVVATAIAAHEMRRP